MTPLVLIWLYRIHPEVYRSARRLLLAATVVALVWFGAMPTAPPRLLPVGYPDVLAQTAEWGWWGSAGSAPRGFGSLTNQYAAMPSMHVGWALWAGAAVALLHHRRAVRTAAAAYPALMTVVVVTTANHYVLDTLAGAAVVLATATIPFLYRRCRCRRCARGGRRPVQFPALLAAARRNMTLPAPWPAVKVEMRTAARISQDTSSRLDRPASTTSAGAGMPGAVTFRASARRS